MFVWLWLVAVLVSAGAVGGAYLSSWWADQRQRSLEGSEAKLQAEWRALYTAQRLNAVFMEARRQMWEEGIRQSRRSDTS